MQAAPASCSTVFNESVLGPIRRHTTFKRSTLPKQSQPQVMQEPSTERDDTQGEHGGNRIVRSAFERMMSAFDAFDKAAVKPIEPQQNNDAVECVDQLLPSNEGTSNVGRGVTIFGDVSGKPEGSGDTHGSQSKKWKDFICGFAEQSKPVYTAAVSHATYTLCIDINSHFISTSNGKSLSMENRTSHQLSVMLVSTVLPLDYDICIIVLLVCIVSESA